DAGCGVGFFSQTLVECGLNVHGFDARGENVAEARRRFPHIPFEKGDIVERAILQLGEFDLVLCFGLLYHLENPLVAIRNLRVLTKKWVLLASTMSIDLAGFRLISEPHEAEDPWSKKPVTATLPQRIGRFLAAPARRKYITLVNRARRVFPGMPIPLRLPFGAWWLAEKS